MGTEIVFTLLITISSMKQKVDRERNKYNYNGQTSDTENVKLGTDLRAHK